MQASKSRGDHFKSVLQALFVTFLWSTSWVFIKIGLKTNLPAITFAGLRYTLAFLCLLPWVILNRPHRNTVQNLTGRVWGELIILGIVFYTLTQGALFVSLSALPAATLNLLLNFSPIVIALYNLSRKNEPASIVQWGGILLTIAGAVIYFMPINIPNAQWLGLIAGMVGLFANSGASLYGRYVNSQSNLPPIIVTAISMGIGGLLLLITGILFQGFGSLGIQQWLIIIWLAIVNTALAFTIWNKTLQTLTAVESSIINGMMTPQIAILAWLFLDEPLGARQIIGICFVGMGTLIVQAWRYLPFSK